MRMQPAADILQPIHAPIHRCYRARSLSCRPPPLLLAVSCCHGKAVYIYEAILSQQQADNWDPSDGDVVNLHGYSQAVAKAAIRSGLSRVLQRFLVAGE